MDKDFRRFAEYLVEVYGVFFDREEEFVICPECGEPIYYCDYPSIWDYTEDENDLYICPICEEILEVE